MRDEVEQPQVLKDARLLLQIAVTGMSLDVDDVAVDVVLQHRFDLRPRQRVGRGWSSGATVCCCQRVLSGRRWRHGVLMQ